MTTNITLDEVARAAGVSVSTASRVISGAVRVAPGKREAVLQAVRDLGYRTNLIARGLASGRSMSVGILTQDISSPYYGEVLRGIEEGLEGSGYSPLFVSGHWRVEEEASALDTLLGRPVDAMIILGGHTPDERLLQIAERLPLMAVGRSIRGLEDTCLRVDNVQGAALVLQHLLELGHRRIAYIGGPASHRDACDRLQGYRQSLEAAGLDFDDALVVEGDFMEASGLLAVESLLLRGVSFTAIMAANDQMAYGARLGLFRRGIRVPEDMSLVGFDDLPHSAFTTPPLTTVRQPTYEMGLAAAQTMLKMLAREPLEAQSFQAELKIRESTARIVRPGRRVGRMATARG